MRLIQTFPIMVSLEEDEYFLMDTNKEELLVVMNSFKKKRILGLDGWTVEFLLAFFELLGEYLLKMVSELKEKGKMPRNLKSTFTALIPKVDHPDTFGYSMLVSMFVESYTFNMAFKRTEQ